MKSKFKLAIITILALSMIFGSALSVSAATTENQVGIHSQGNMESISPRSNSFPYTSYSNSLAINTSWKTIATSSTGFNGHVRIHCRNDSSNGMVRLLDSYGNVVYTSSNATSVPRDGSYSYWCGSNVYTIQIKTQSGGGSAWTQWEG